MEIDFYMLQDIFNGNPISLEVNVRKVTFNNVPEVSAVIPKNFKKIELELFNKQTDEF